MLASEQVETSKKEKIKHLAQLIVEAGGKQPSKAAVKALDKFLEDNPDVWGEVSNMAETVTGALIEKICAGNPAMSSIRTKECCRIVEELGYADSSAVEQLLIKQIIMCWLRLWWTEFYATQFTMAANYNMKVADHWEKKLTYAQKRYTRAIESLARVRKITRATKAEPAESSQPDSRANAGIRALNPARLAG